MSVELILHLNAKRETRENLQTFLGDLQSTLPEVEGCVGIRIYSCIENPTLFTIVESWTSQELHQQHIQKVQATPVWSELINMLEEAPKADYFRAFRS